MMPMIHAIRQLWALERQQGTYSPVAEVTLDLEVLDARALQDLHDRIAQRVQTAHDETPRQCSRAGVRYQRKGVVQ